MLHRSSSEAFTPRKPSMAAATAPNGNGGSQRRASIAAGEAPTGSPLTKSSSFHTTNSMRKRRTSRTGAYAAGNISFQDDLTAELTENASFSGPTEGPQVGGQHSKLPALLNNKGSRRYRKQSIKLPNGNLVDISHIPAKEAEATLGKDAIIVHEEEAEKRARERREAKKRMDAPIDLDLNEVMNLHGQMRRKTLLLELQKHKGEPSSLAERRETKRRETQQRFMSGDHHAGEGTKPAASNGATISAPSMRRIQSITALLAGPKKSNTLPKVKTPRERHEEDMQDLSPRLQLLPDIKNCQSACEYVNDRIALLRQSDDLRSDFKEKVRCDARLKKEIQQEKTETLQAELSEHPHRVSGKDLAEANKDRRIDQLRESAAKSRALVDQVKEKQVVAQCRRDYLAMKPLLIKMWTINMYLWRTAVGFRAVMAQGYIARWKRLVVLYCARHWLRRTRQRRRKIQTLHLNFFIRRHLPTMMNNFRQRRMEQALPLVKNFLQHHHQVKKMSRVVGDFFCRLRTAQRLVRKRRVIKTLNRLAMQAAWERENAKLVERREILLVFPTDFRDRVIDCLMNLEAKEYYRRRRGVMDDYVAQLERSEKLEMAEQQLFMDNQSVLVQEALNTVFSHKSTFAPPGMRSSVLTGLQEDAPDHDAIKRRLISLYLKAEVHRLHEQARLEKSRFIRSPNQGGLAPHPPGVSRTRSGSQLVTHGRSQPAHKAARGPGGLTAGAFLTASNASPGQARSPFHPTSPPRPGEPQQPQAPSSAFQFVFESIDKKHNIPQLTAEDYVALPMFDKDDAMYAIFQRVKKPKFPKRKFLPTPRNMRILLRMSKDALLEAFKETMMKQQVEAAASKAMASMAPVPSGEQSTSIPSNSESKEFTDSTDQHSLEKALSRKSSMNPKRHSIQRMKNTLHSVVDQTVKQGNEHGNGSGETTPARNDLTNKLARKVSGASSAASEGDDGGVVSPDTERELAAVKLDFLKTFLQAAK